MHVLQHLTLMQNPSMVLCKATFKAKELVLVAAATSVLKRSCTMAIGLGKYSLPGTPHTFEAFLAKEPFTFKQEQLTWCAPFWMVQTDEDAPNMQMDFKEVVVDNTTAMIPYLFNKKRIEAGTILTVNRKVAVKLAAASPKKQRRA